MGLTVPTRVGEKIECVSGCEDSISLEIAEDMAYLDSRTTMNDGEETISRITIKLDQSKAEKLGQALLDWAKTQHNSEMFDAAAATRESREQYGRIQAQLGEDAEGDDEFV